MPGEIRLSGITIYPVKSCAGIALRESPLDALGLEHDRRWMVTDNSGQFLSQRSHPQMALIQPRIENSRLILQREGMEDFAVPPTDPAMPRLNSTVWEETVESLHPGAESDAWISRAIGEDCRLVQIAPEARRQVDPAYSAPNERTAYTDGFPLLLISEASLKELNRRLEKPLDMRHFRPNLVVSGCDPHAEDTWQNITIGGLVMRVVKPCSRCVITTVDPDTGKKAGAEPLTTLSAYRKLGNKVYFGQNLIHQSPGKLTLGDPCVVVESDQAARISLR